VFIIQRVRPFVSFFFSFVTLLILTRVFANPGIVSSASTAIAIDAQNIEFVGHIGGATKAVDVQGNYAYVSEGFALTILDVSNPAEPIVASRTMLPFEVSDIEVLGDYIYVACGNRGLRILNVSNPSEPVEIGFYITRGANKLAVAGNYVYVAALDNGLHIIDVSNPSTPTAIGYYGENAVDVAVAGDFAYLAHYDSGGLNGLIILDITYRDDPNRVSLYLTDNPFGVTVAGNYVYIADWSSGLRIIDITDPAVPKETSMAETSGNARDVNVVGGYAYIADGDKSGLSVIDIADPATPVVTGSYDTPGAAIALDVAGDYAYVADGAAGLQIIDVSDPGTPVKTGVYDPAGYAIAQHIEKVGNMVFITATEGGLRIVDISNPSTPVEIGSFQTWEGAREVAVAASYAYVSGSSDPYDNAGAFLQVINVADPANPVGSGLIEPWWGWPYSLAASGNYVYGAAGNYGFVTFDVIDPTKPMEIAQINSSDNARDVAVTGNHAYIADEDGGLRIIDLSNPIQPKEVGFYRGEESELLESAYAVDASEEFAYTANGNGLRVLAMSDPTNPIAMGMYESPISSQKFIAIDGNYGVIADTSARRISLIDISNPSEPTEVGYYQPPDYVQDIAIHDNFIYVALHDSGFLILRFNDPSKGYIVVDKVTNPGEELQSFEFKLTGGPDILDEDFSLTDTGDPWDSGYLKPGMYNVTETTPSGWFQESTTCDDGSDPLNIQLGAGETVTCTFTNTKLDPAGEFSVYLPGVMGKNKLPNHQPYLHAYLKLKKPQQSTGANYSKGLYWWTNLPFVAGRHQ
jgi:hypothetical protein